MYVINNFKNLFKKVHTPVLYKTFYISYFTYVLSSKFQCCLVLNLIFIKIYPGFCRKITYCFSARKNERCSQGNPFKNKFFA